MGVFSDSQWQLVINWSSQLPTQEISICWRNRYYLVCCESCESLPCFAIFSGCQKIGNWLLASFTLSNIPTFLCKSTSGCCYKCVRGRLSCQSHLEKKCNRKCQIYFPSWLERFSARALLWEKQWFGSICFVFFVIFKVLGINLVVLA